MVSFQALLPLSPNTRNTIIPDFEISTNKRKSEESQLAEQTFDKRPKTDSINSIFDIELHLETPLPLEWQRCLDIQSGQIHFYNTRTHKRTCRDPRKSPEPPSSPNHMSLELELNLPSESLRKTQARDRFPNHNNSGTQDSVDDHLLMDSSTNNKKNNSGGLNHRPSWLASEGEDHQREMVATVCTRCHMLVMLCKSSPACPNCKFMHPPDQSPPKLFNQRLRLLC